MSAVPQRTLQLYGNQLKLIGLVSMTIDHIGVLLFPSAMVLRLIGRLSFPIFAHMIAEGWQYTHNRRRYALTMWLFGLAIQVVYYIVGRSLYQCIFITYGLSLLLIRSIEWAQLHKNAAWLLPTAVCAAIAFVCEGLPRLLPHTDFAIDYGFCGVLLPALAYFPRSRQNKLLCFAAGLLMLGIQNGAIQYAGLLALLPLLIYNGRRGKWKLKNLFYIYYPAHLVILWVIAMLIQR